MTDDKFCGKFYRKWAPQAKLKLKAAELWDVVEGKATDAACNEKALISLANMVSFEAWPENADGMTAAQIWASLKATYDDDSSKAQSTTMMAFNSLKVEDKESLQEFGARARTAINELKAKGCPLEPIYIRSFLVTKLREAGPRMETFYQRVAPDIDAPVELLLSQMDTTIIGPILGANTNVEERALSTTSRGMEGEILRLLRSLTAGGHHRKRRPCRIHNIIHEGVCPEAICWNCQKKGHVAHNCPIKGNDAYLGGEERMTFILDGGCSQTMVPKGFFPFDKATTGTVRTASGTELNIVGQKDARIFDTMLPVSVVDGLTENLLSEMQLVKSGFQIVKETPLKAEISKNGKVVASAHVEDGLWKVHLNFNSNQSALTALSLNDAHIRTAHLNARDLRDLPEHVENLNIIESKAPLECESCIFGKFTRKNQNRVARRSARHVGDIISADLLSGFPESPSGYKYLSMLVDKYSGFFDICLLRSKRAKDVLSHIQTFIAKLERNSGHRVRTFRCDNGSEYTADETVSYLRQQGITMEYTAVNHPEANGLSERMHRTLLDRARAIKIDVGCPDHLWSYVVYYACQTINRTNVRKHLHMTAYEVVTGRKANINDMVPFGHTVHVHLIEQGNKLAPRSCRGVYLGPVPESESHFILTDDLKVICSIQFKETAEWDRPYSSNTMQKFVSKMLNERNVQTQHDRPHPGSHNDTSLGNSNDRSEVVTIPLSSTTTDSPIDVPIEVESNDTPVEVEPNDTPRRSTRPNRYTGPLGEQELTRRAWNHTANLASDVTHIQVGDTPSFDEALKSRFREATLSGLQRELTNMHKMGVFTLTQVPPNRRIVDSKLVITVKDENLVKVRLVARGFTQVEGIDYLETYAPVAKISTIRILIAWALTKGYQLHQMDIDCAYLNAPLEEEVYLKPPPGIDIEIPPGHAYKLNKAIYGLKQAGRAWFETLSSTLFREGFRNATNDQCLFMRQRHGKYEFIAAYVDDLLIAAPTLEDVTNIKTRIAKNFDCKDLGPLKQYLGVQIVQSPQNGLTFNQGPLIERTCRKLSIDRCFNQPFVGDLHPETAGGVELDVSGKKRYQSIVGSLLYISQHTRPDLLALAIDLGRYASKPTTGHLSIAERAMGYLLSTKDDAVEYRETTADGNLVVFSDANWGGDLNERRSTSGSVVYYFGMPVIWKSRTQKCIASSTMESEYVAGGEAAKDGIMAQMLLEEMGEKTKPTLYLDNQAAIHFASGEDIGQRGRHIEIQYHYLRDIVRRGMLDVKFVSGTQNPADGLTKFLKANKRIESRDHFKIVSNGGVLNDG